MADGKLVFPIKFDLDSAVRNATGDIDRVLRRMQTEINARPLTIKPTIDDADLKRMSQKLESLSIPRAAVGSGKDMFTAQEGSIHALNAAMKKCIEDWNKLAESERIVNRESGEYSAKAQQIIERFATLTAASETYAKSLSQIVAESKRAADAEIKNNQKAQQEKDRLIAKSREKVAVLNAEETTLSAVAAKQKHFQQIADGSDFGSKRYVYATQQVERLGAQYLRLQEIMRDNTGNKGKDIFGMEKLRQTLRGSEDTIQQVQTKLKALNQVLATTPQDSFTFRRMSEEARRLIPILDEMKRKQKEATTLSVSIPSMPENSIADLTAKIQAYRNVMKNSDFGSKQFTDAMTAASNLTTKLEGMNKAVADQEKWRVFNQAIASATNTMNSLNAQISAWRTQMNGLEIGSAKWLQAAENVARLSRELQQATQWAQDFQQKAFQGLSSPMLQKRVEETQQLRARLQDLTEQFNRLQSAGLATDSSGNFTAKAIDIFQKRADVLKEIAAKTRDADSAQQAYDNKLKEEEAELKRLTEAEAKRNKHLRDALNIMNANEQRIEGLNQKLQRYQQIISRLAIGSDAWNRSALEIRRLTEELTRANQQLADFQQRSFQGLADANVISQTQRLAALRQEIKYIDDTINQINYRASKGITLSSDQAMLDAALTKRIAKQKEIQSITKSAEDYALEKEKQITEEKRKQEALLKKQQERTRQKNLLASDAKDIDTLTKKLQYYRSLLNRLDPNTKSGTFLAVAKEVEKLTDDLDKAKRKVDELTGAQKRQQGEVSNAYRQQSSYLERLIKRMTVYASVGAIAGFLTKIREVTAEFELQRISLGAIIQDQQRANQLFSEIKSFALKSPLKILDLTKYTKQVAAYRIETDKLFDTTKRLADVSVGLGVDMSRIVLAYGQVKAASYLRAAEVRQFTEAGIPMLELLAEKFTKLQGEVVSTEEVMDKISKRMVTFSMVEDIFKDMTDQGGIFYNMQEKQSQTLYGMWAKMGDAAAVMYEQMGNTALVNSKMKGLIEIMTELMNHWTALANIVQTGAIGFAAYKLAMAGLLPTFGLKLKQTINQVWAEKRHNATILEKLGLFATLDTKQQKILANKSKLTQKEWEQVIVTGKLNQATAIRLARMAKEDADLQKALIRKKIYNQAQLTEIQNMGKWEFRLAMLRAKLLSVREAALRMWASMKAWLPVLGPMLAFTAITDLFFDWRQASNAQAEAAKKVEKKYGEVKVTLMEIRNAYNDILEASKAAGDAVEENVGAKEEALMSSFSKKIEILEKIIKELKKFGMQNFIDPSVLDYSNIDEVIDKWIAKLEEANEVARDFGHGIAKVNNAYEGNVMGWSIFGENMKEDFKDWERSWANLLNNDYASESLQRMRAVLGDLKTSNNELYLQISRTIGADAQLAMGQKRRNESELAYQERIYANFVQIGDILGKHDGFDFKLSAGIMSGYWDEFLSDTKEVYHEFDKVKGRLRGQDALTVKMAIDTIAAENDWQDWQKEALIKHLNEKPITLNAEIIPLDMPAGTPGVTQGMKAIITSQYEGLFTENELQSLVSTDGIVKAIKQKLDSATEKLKEAYELENNIGKGSETYKNTLAKIEKLQAEITEYSKMRKELEGLESVDDSEKTDEQMRRQTELRIKLSEMDQESINAKHAQIQAYVEMNAKLDSQIEKQRESAEAERDLAKAALERVTSDGLSSLGKDVKEQFAGLMVDAKEEIKNNDYSTDFLISEDELAKIRDVADLYEIWAKNTKAIAEEKKKLADAGISEAKIEKDRIALDEKKKGLNDQLLQVENQIKANKWEELVIEYNKLKVALANATTEEARKKAQEDLNRFLANENNARAANLALAQQQLQAELKQNLVAAAANNQIKDYLKRLDELEEEYKNVGERYNFKLQEKEKKGRKGGSEDDPWILLYKNRMKFMKDFQKGVEDLTKWMGYANGLAEEQENMLGRGLSLKIDSRKLNGTREELIDWYENTIEEIRKKIAKMGGKEWEGIGVQMILAKDTKSRVLKKYQELLADYFKELTDFRTKKLQEDLEKKLKELQESISRTKTAKEFFEKILAQTGDIEVAASVSISIYGEDGYELKKQLAEQIQAYFKNSKQDIRIPLDVIAPDFSINYRKLAEFAEKMKDSIGEKPYQEIKKIAEQGQKDLAKSYEGYFKDLQKAETYASKRIRLAQETAEKIRKIRQDIEMGNIKKNVGEEIVNGLIDKEARDAARLEWDAFKGTPLYVQMFEDLEHASTSTLEMMQHRLSAISRVWGSALDPTQLKEMQSRLNEITSQLRDRNPWKALKQSWKEYRDATSSVSLKGSAQRAADASKDFYESSEIYGKDSVQAKEAEKELEARNKIVSIVKAITAEQKKQVKGQKALTLAQQKAFDNAKIARGQLEIAEAELKEAENEALKNNVDPAKDPGVLAAQQRVEMAQEEVDLAERVSEILDRNARKSKTWRESLEKTADTIFQGLNAAGELATGIGDIMESLNADENDVAFWHTIGEAMGEITGGLQDIVQSAFKGDVMGIITSTVSAIPRIFTGFVDLFSANRVRKANKEIERQQKILDQLEYTYGRLEQLASKVFGSDYISNFNSQIKSLEAQMAAKQAQLAAEQSKGKKTDNNKVQEYKNDIRALKDQIADLYGTISQQMLGTDLSSAARDFAQAWLDAYKEFSKTSDAMSDKFKDMVENMVVEGALAKVMERALRPMFDMIDQMDETDFYSQSFWSRVVSEAEKGADAANYGAGTMMKFLEQAGINLRELGGELTGISREVGSATSEEINLWGAALNTQNFYIAQQLAEVRAIRALIEQGSGTPVATPIDYSEYQNTALNNLAAIERHTAETVSECKNIAARCEEQTTLLRRVIGTKGSVQGVNVLIKDWGKQ